MQVYCNYEKQGNKYIIKEVYKQPQITIDDLLKSKNSKYIKLLANIILEYLYKNPEDLQQIPLMQLFSMLGVTNINYNNANNYRKELSQLYNIQLASIYFFYDNTRNEFKKIIERCLNNLQGRSVLFWNKCIVIIDKDNKTTYKADKETQELILDTQKEVLQEIQCKNMYDMIKDKAKRKEFNNIISKEIGFNYYYAYDIIIGKKAIQIEYDNIQQDKQELNLLIQNKSNRLFNKQMYKSYKEDYTNLINLLIDINNNDDLLKQLKNKNIENTTNYIAESLELDNKHQAQEQELKNTYLDIYKI